MKQIKLTPVQQQKMIRALQKEAALKEQKVTAERLHSDAVQSRQDTLEMIADAHGINLKQYQDNVQLKDGVLILQEKQKEGDKIKQTLKKAAHESKLKVSRKG